MLAVLDRGAGKELVRGMLHGNCVSGLYSLHWLQGEVFALKFRFDNSYPFGAPIVTFVVDNKYQAPLHPVSTPVARRINAICLIW